MKPKKLVYAELNDLDYEFRLLAYLPLSARMEKFVELSDSIKCIIFKSVCGHWTPYKISK